MRRFRRGLIVCAVMVISLSTLSAVKVFAQPWNQGYFEAHGKSAATTKNNAFYFEDGLAAMGTTAMSSEFGNIPKVDYKIYKINKLSPDTRIDYLSDVGTYYSKQYNVVSGNGYYFEIVCSPFDIVYGYVFGGNP